MKLGKIFICINILVLSLLMLTGCTNDMIQRLNEQCFAIGEKYIEIGRVAI